MVPGRKHRGGHLPADGSTPQVARATDFLLDQPIAVVARVVARGRGSIERVEALTPQVVETIVEDARAAGRGAALTLTIRSPIAPRTLARVRDVFAGLIARGVQVHVTTDPIVPPTSRRPAA
jgi:hypothetical protein